jgi:hypothetical protein
MDAEMLLLPPTPEEIRDVACRIQAEVAWQMPGHRTWLGYKLAPLLDGVHRWYKMRFDAVSYAQSIREMRTSHDARTVVLRLAAAGRANDGIGVQVVRRCATRRVDGRVQQRRSPGRHSHPR